MLKQKAAGGLWVALCCACTQVAPVASSPDAGRAEFAEEIEVPKGPPRVVPVTSRSPEALQAFTEARSLDDNNRDAEALRGFKKALELDPTFAFAQASVAYHTQGPEGLKGFERAIELARTQGLPEAEQLFIQYLSAQRQDHAKAPDLIERVIRLAPDDWRASFELGQQAFVQRKWTLAVEAYKKSMAINRTCTAYNNVAYARAMQGHFDLGILALQKCIELQPKEPNPLDSLGEIQLAAGQLDQAESTFRKAIELDSNFFTAWHGIAVARFFRGDWAGGYAALKSARAATLEPSDRFEVDVITAWAQLAEGKGAAGLQTLTRMEKEAGALGEAATYSVIWGQINRAALLHELGKDADALATVKGALERLSKTRLPADIGAGLRRRALAREAMAESALGDLDGAARTLDALGAAQREWAENPELASARHLAEGSVLVARGKWPEAIKELSGCVLEGLTEWGYDYRTKPEDTYCRWLLYRAQIHEHDAGAAATRQELVARVSREAPFLYIHAKLAAP